jgi:transposase-like protein
MLGDEMKEKIIIIALLIVLAIAVAAVRYYRIKYKDLRSIVFKRRSQMPMVDVQCPHCTSVFEGEQPGYFAKFVGRKCPICDFEWDEEVEGHCTIEDGMYSTNMTARIFRRSKEDEM